MKKAKDSDQEGRRKIAREWMDDNQSERTGKKGIPNYILMITFFRPADTVLLF